jgi:tetraacyldisaccharide 4'-kinase
MKTPRFWYPAKNDHAAAFVAGALSPLSCVFAAGTFLRRLFTKPHHARVPIVCIGNVVAGGAGKTPTALAVARMLREHGQRPVFVTRGYGGHGQLVCVNLAEHEAEDVGDEALLLAAVAPTWAGGERVDAVRLAESHGTVILMDDGLQNPTIAPTISILVIDGDVGTGNGHIIPAGPLRENLAQALKRVAAMIIIGDSDRHNLAATAKVPVFRAHMQPDLPKGFPRKSKFVAFAGIGRPEKFYATARALKLKIVATCDFPDHHVFTPADIDGLRLQAEEEGAHLLTTEKDAVRLPPDFRAETLILPVRLVFHEADAEERLARLCISSCAL